MSPNWKIWKLLTAVECYDSQVCGTVAKAKYTKLELILITQSQRQKLCKGALSILMVVDNNYKVGIKEQMI